ncbi:hypothetical protein NPIL_60751 [Nephila pilipes]|uniref:Uncharacterized protein n=1 Tax=Nephila pilipes TaxID=299642 RepID=A0A8X6UP38_NEPPI|nr:hypothetical protein NPIL_60751 [Nephila pilipes]
MLSASANHTIRYLHLFIDKSSMDSGIVDETSAQYLEECTKFQQYEVNVRQFIFLPPTLLDRRIKNIASLSFAETIITFQADDCSKMWAMVSLWRSFTNRKFSEVFILQMKITSLAFITQQFAFQVLHNSQGTKAEE